VLDYLVSDRAEIFNKREGDGFFLGVYKGGKCDLSLHCYGLSNVRDMNPTGYCYPTCRIGYQETFQT